MYLYINNKHVFSIEAWSSGNITVSKQQGAVVPFDDYFDIIVSGSYEGTIVHTIPEKYMPDYDAIVELDATGSNWNYTLVKGNYNSLLDKFESGKLPKILYKKNDGNITLVQVISIKYIASTNLLDCKTFDDAFAIFSDNRVEAP